MFKVGLGDWYMLPIGNDGKRAKFTIIAIGRQIKNNWYAITYRDDGEGWALKENDIKKLREENNLLKLDNYRSCWGVNQEEIREYRKYYEYHSAREALYEVE